MSTNELYLIQSDRPRSLDGIDVKTTHETVLYAHPAAFHVVGESHAVSVPALPFYELFSCRPTRTEQTPNTAITTVELSLDIEVNITHTFENHPKSVHTTVRTEPLASFPDTESFTIVYKFDTDAYTAIKCISQSEYRTYHTYPEHDLTVISYHQVGSPLNTESLDAIEPNTQ
ncbi:DUF2617 family protein [Haloquadratum walsbyi]|jgi:Protein of unknown function DUF2617.|uniref:Uncharacterized protein n=1 Tax=Haloquadratum walsbyi J07HQW2 TaxID=1238425 RepID=U1PT81_9EURY|nr:DUF2617 family protein [Haloquadratum walsbyi]ERG96997.1 MAG: protein of unknown function DUF2617 [Haloquadratum walsbyi J07HQW2]